MESLRQTKPETLSSSFFEKENWLRLLWNREKSCILIPPRLQEFAESLNEELQEEQIGLFSSGSTGEPRVVALSKDKLILNARISTHVFGLQKDQNVLILASPWHVAGLTWAASADLGRSKWSIHAPYLDKMETFAEQLRITSYDKLFTVPSVLRALHETGKPWHVDHIVVGGASLQQDDYDWVHLRCDHLTQAYGQTEAGGLISSFSSLSSLLYDRDLVKCVGSPASPIKIACDGSREHPSDIIVQSPTAHTEQPYPSGDLGFIDEKGRLHITGRTVQKQGNCNSLSGMTMVMHK